jgi:hypothetical protein
VGGLAEFLGEAMVVAGEVVSADVECRQRRRIGEVENLREVGVELPQLAGGCPNRADRVRSRLSTRRSTVAN